MFDFRNARAIHSKSNSPCILNNLVSEFYGNLLSKANQEKPVSADRGIEVLIIPVRMIYSLLRTCFPASLRKSTAIASRNAPGAFPPRQISATKKEMRSMLVENLYDRTALFRQKFITKQVAVKGLGGRKWANREGTKRKGRTAAVQGRDNLIPPPLKSEFIAFRAQTLCPFSPPTAREK